MQFKNGSLLGTAFSAALLIGQGITLPQDLQCVEAPTAIVQSVPQAFENHHMQLAMLERRRLLYEARTNTVIMTNMAVAAQQEVAMQPHLSL